MIKNILSKKFKTIGAAAIVIALLGLLSRLLGIFRDHVLARQFGAGDALDIYYAAFRVPDLVYNLIVLGALSAGFIPVFIALIKNEEGGEHHVNKDAWTFVSNMINILAIFLIGAGLFLAAISHWLVPLITPGFDGEKLQLTINVTRIMFLSPVFLGISGVLGGVLQSFKRFLVFALAPVMYNLGIILGALVFVRFWGIYGLAWGVILGAGLHLLIQLPVVWKLGFNYQRILSFKDKHFVKVVKLMVPRVLGLASSQLNLIVITVLASTIAAGSIAIFNLSNNLQSFPLGLFGVSYAIAAFPVLARSFSQKNEAEFQAIFTRAFRQIMFYIIPISIGFIILRFQVVRVILGAGQFDIAAIQLTAASLGIFSFSMFAQTLLPLFARAFYARHNTIIPFVASFIGLLTNVFVSLYLVTVMGVLGLALGFTISSIVNFLIVAIMLRVESRGIYFQGMFKSIGKIIVASAITGVALQFVKTGLAPYVDITSFWSVFGQAAAAGFAGFFVFCLTCYFLRSEEFMAFWEFKAKKLLRKVRPEKEGFRGNDLT